MYCIILDIVECFWSFLVFLISSSALESFNVKFDLIPLLVFVFFIFIFCMHGVYLIWIYRMQLDASFSLVKLNLEGEIIVLFVCFFSFCFFLATNQCI